MNSTYMKVLLSTKADSPHVLGIHEASSSSCQLNIALKCLFCHTFIYERTLSLFPPESYAGPFATTI